MLPRKKCWVAPQFILWSQVTYRSLLIFPLFLLTPERPSPVWGPHQYEALTSMRPIWLHEDRKEGIWCRWPLFRFVFTSGVESGPFSEGMGHHSIYSLLSSCFDVFSPWQASAARLGIHASNQLSYPSLFPTLLSCLYAWCAAGSHFM